VKASRGEIKICDILDEAGIPYQEEYSFPDLVSTSGRPLRFDWAIFDDDGETIICLLEYDGIQHFEAKPNFGGKRGLFRQKFNDESKRKYCVAHGLKLVRIPYWEDQFVDYDYLAKRIYDL
jgi:hypothetical protein